MGNINDNIRSKKLYKSGEVNEASKDSEGNVVVPAEVAAELDAIDSITEVMNDSGIFQHNKHLIKEIENMRLDIEELHGFIKDAFGKDYTQASSKGATGDRGLRGYTGASGANGAAGAKGDTGSAGSNGKNGSDGNSHLSNITSIGINGKSGQLEIVIGRSTYKFNTDK
tara:strand:+ start:334 stop:840 length:507 start_codon:yes stop_codon:yes gene_type:complete